MLVSAIALLERHVKKTKENTKKTIVAACARECIRFLSIIEFGLLVTYLYMLLPMWRKY